MYNKKTREAYDRFESSLYETVVDYLKGRDIRTYLGDIELEDDYEGCIAESIFLNESEEPIVVFDTGEFVTFWELSPINKIRIVDMM